MVYCLCSFVSQQEDQTINLISNQIYHQINGVLLSSSNLVNVGWLWQLSQGNGVNQKQSSKYFERIMILNV